RASNHIEKYFYDAVGYQTVTDQWGNETGHASSHGNRFMYTGREWIAELGIYDYRHRMYHPGLGRFLQSDPTGFDAGDMNLFRYCGDDPVDRSDPTGLLADHTYERQLWLYGSNFQGSFAEFEQMRHPAGIIMATMSEREEGPKSGNESKISNKARVGRYDMDGLGYKTARAK